MSQKRIFVVLRLLSFAILGDLRGNISTAKTARLPFRIPGGEQAKRRKGIIQISSSVMMRFFLPLFTFLLFSCSGAHRLSELERSKLDPAVQRLFAQDRVADTDYDTTLRPGGEKEYGLIVRSINADELKKAGIRISSIFGDVITVRVTLEELKKLVSLPSVRSVQNGSKNYPQQ